MVAESLGTALLLATVIGSGIMGERLAGGNVAVALLANTLATGAALVALILTFGPISGAHFNPAVTLADAWQGGIRWADVLPYLGAQIAGRLRRRGGGPRDVRAAALLRVSARPGGLRADVQRVRGHVRAACRHLGCVRARPSVVPFAVAAYITAAYWFTASTSFANPAVTLARAASDTFAGIRPSDAPGFIVAQLTGAAAATGLFRWLIPTLPESAPDVVVRSR